MTKRIISASDYITARTLSATAEPLLVAVRTLEAFLTEYLEKQEGVLSDTDHTAFPVSYLSGLDKRADQAFLPLVDLLHNFRNLYRSEGCSLILSLLEESPNVKH